MRDDESTFAKWAAEQAHVRTDELDIEVVGKLPRKRDLPDGPPSDTGGYVASDHESVTESEMDRLAKVGDKVVEGFRSRRQTSD
jgi:hypothetical protein